MSSAQFSNTTNMANYSILHDDVEGESMSTKTIRIVGYVVLFILGVFGNFMVILAVRNPKMRTVTNAFIANLGLADLLVVVFNIPSVVTYAHLWQWPFGEALCKVLPFLQGLTLNASVGTLIAIAADRYWHIVLFKRKKIPLRHAYKMITMIWVCSSLIPLPLLIYCKVLVITVKNIEYVLCEEVWPDMTSRQIYTMVIFLALYLFPLLVLSCLYFIIARSLKRQPVVPSSRQEGSKREAQKRIVRMLVVVVILFAFCWLPYHAVFLYIDFFQPVRTQSLVTAILLSQWLVYASSVCNPVVYALLNPNFRREFFEMLSSCKKVNICVIGEISCRAKVASSESNSTNSASYMYESSV